MKTLSYISSLNSKMKHKCIHGRLHATRINQSLHSKSGEHSQNKYNTFMFHGEQYTVFFDEKQQLMIPPIERQNSISNMSCFFKI